MKKYISKHRVGCSCNLYWKKLRILIYLTKALLKRTSTAIFKHEESWLRWIVIEQVNHFTFRFRAYFEQGVPWHSGNYRVWIHSEMRTWHDENIQSGKLLLSAYISWKKLCSHTFKASSEEIIVCILRKNAKYMKEVGWKSFFR